MKKRQFPRYPTFPEVSLCFEILNFVTSLTFVTGVTTKHDRPLKKVGITFLG